MIRHLLTLFSYVAGVTIVVVVTVVLVAYGRGYTYDFTKGRLTQTGLVLVQSSPAGSAVDVNGKSTGKRTPFRGAFETGKYTIELAKDGYVSWKKVLSVVASEVTDVKGVILVPVKPQSNILDTRSSVVAQTMSRDRRHLAYVTTGIDSGVYTLDVGNGKIVKAYTPKVATATLPSEVITNVSWSDDASHLLVSGTQAANPIYRVVPSGGGDAINLTEQYGFAFNNLQFSGYSWKQLYWISTDGLRRLDLDAQSVSAVLADKVVQFNIYGDRLLYVQTTDLGKTLWSLDNRGRKQELIQALPESPTYSITLANYHNQDVLAVIPSKTRIATLYRGIFGQNPVSQAVAREVDLAVFAPDAHMVSFYSPSGMQTYDFDLSDIQKTPVLYQSPIYPGAITALSWFDNYHVLINRNGRLQWCDFDGTNSVDLGAIQSSGLAYGSADARNVYAFQPDASSGIHIIGLIIRP